LQQSGEALPTYAHAVKRSGETLTVFEANHGAALDIAEQNIADPSGLIHAAILLLQHVDQQETATLIHHAWLKAQEDNILPAELGTAAYAEAIIDRLGQQPTQQQ
jgi:isocitrate dehydrogenase